MHTIKIINENLGFHIPYVILCASEKLLACKIQAQV